MTEEELWALPRTRAEARATGSTWYFTGVACVNGHVEYRNTASHNCAGCWREQSKARPESARSRERARKRRADWNKRNPEKVKAVTDGGIACEQISLTVEPNEFNKKYLATKADRLGHSGGK